MSRTTTITAGERLRLNVPDKRTELRGALVIREPAGHVHGRLAAKLASLLVNHVQAHDFGCVLAAETRA